MDLAAFAPAKVNLFLHVGAPGADGYHPLCSLMAFADCGDRLRVVPADALALRVTVPSLMTSVRCRTILSPGPPWR